MKDCEHGRGTAFEPASLFLGRRVMSCSEVLIVVGFGNSRLHHSLFDTSSVFILVAIEFHRSLLPGRSRDRVPALRLGHGF